MTLSEVIDALTKVKNLIASTGEEAGVILHSVEGDVETVIHAIGVQFAGASSGPGPQVTLTHGAAPPPAPVEPPPPADPPVDEPTG
jgi:hypothetical protein